MTAPYDWTPHLEDGEKLLWQGRPDQRFFIPTPQDFWTLVFWLGVAGLLTFTGFSEIIWHADGTLNAFGILFLSAVLLIPVIRVTHDLRVRRNEHYAITTTRAMVGAKARPTMIRQVALHADLTIVAQGRAYPIVAFTRYSPKTWRLRRLLYADGPPPPGHDRRGADLLFRVPEDAVTVAQIAQTAALQRTT